MLSKGYTEYKESKLYKEIVESSKKIKAEKQVVRDEKLKEKLKKEVKLLPVARDDRSEISELRREIIDLKKDVKEMLRLMNALYDFELQQTS